MTNAHVQGVVLDTMVISWLLDDRQDRHHPARAPHRAGNRPGHRRTRRGPDLPRPRQRTAGPAGGLADRPTTRPEGGHQQARWPAHAPASVHHRRPRRRRPAPRRPGGGQPRRSAYPRCATTARESPWIGTRPTLSRPSSPEPPDRGTVPIGSAPDATDVEPSNVVEDSVTRTSSRRNAIPVAATHRSASWIFCESAWPTRLRSARSEAQPSISNSLVWITSTSTSDRSSCRRRSSPQLARSAPYRSSVTVTNDTTLERPPMTRRASQRAALAADPAANSPRRCRRRESCGVVRSRVGQCRVEGVPLLVSDVLESELLGAQPRPRVPQALVIHRVQAEMRLLGLLDYGHATSLGTRTP